jgi:hypothetical protein
MSSLPSESPKLSKLPFLAFDGILLGTAALVAWQSDVPLSGASLLAVVGCVALAAIVCVIPFLTDYARSQELALDERQRALESLSQTIAVSAEQLGVAVQGVTGVREEFQALGEQLNKTLKHAELLPLKLNEKIGELQQRIAVARDEELEDLEKEVSALRASEGERLEAAADKISKAIAELARAEGLIAQMQTQAKGQVSLVAQEAGQAAAQISKAAEEAADKAARHIDEQVAKSKSSLADTFAAGKAEIDEDLGRRHQELHTLLQSLGQEIGGKLAGVCTQVEDMLTQARQLAEEARRLSVPPPAVIIQAPPAPVVVPAPLPEPAPAVIAPEPSPVLVEAQPEPVEVAEVPALSTIVSEPELVAPVVEVPVTPESPAEPAEAELSPVISAEPVMEAQPEAPAAEPQRQPLQKKGRKQGGESSSLDLFSSDYNFEDAMVSHERSPVSSALSSDGATRLVVTSYIGIGNKLFLRGDGPGLSWDHGQPLEFVSIGKWRWQSSELTSSVKVRLFKNDRSECPGLGDIQLEPGHQTEVTAKF